MIRFREKMFSTTLLEDTQHGFRNLADKVILEPVDKTLDYVEDIDINNKKPLKRKFKRITGIVKPIRKLIENEEEKYKKKSN